MLVAWNHAHAIFSENGAKSEFQGHNPKFAKCGVLIRVHVTILLASYSAESFLS